MHTVPFKQQGERENRQSQSAIAGLSTADGTNSESKDRVASPHNADLYKARPSTCPYCHEAGGFSVTGLSLAG